MKTKLEMAHEYAMAQMVKDELHTDLAKRAWDYVDAMQAEADKREKQNKDEFYANLADPMKKVREQEWQPDWSQAPDNLVKYFAVDENGRGGWFISKPTLCIDHWYWSDFEERVDNDHYDYAPSFGYTGDWRESLRKRPK